MKLSANVVLLFCLALAGCTTISESVYEDAAQMTEEERVAVFERFYFGVNGAMSNLWNADFIVREIPFEAKTGQGRAWAKSPWVGARLYGAKTSNFFGNKKCDDDREHPVAFSDMELVDYGSIVELWVRDLVEVDRLCGGRITSFKFVAHNEDKQALLTALIASGVKVADKLGVPEREE
jgi:hypothetical protein